MDHQVDLLEFGPDDLEQIPCGIGSDGKHLGRVGVWFEIKNGDGVLKGVTNSSVVDAVLVSRTVDLHTSKHIVIRNLQVWKTARIGDAMNGRASPLIGGPASVDRHDRCRRLVGDDAA